jgi:hypothetical protein
MAWTLDISTTALRDIQIGIDWYKAQQKGLGKKFEKPGAWYF